MTHLQGLACGINNLLQFQHFFHRQADGLFTKHMLARLQSADRGGDVESVRGGDDHGFHRVVGQHRVIVQIDGGGVIESAKAVGQACVSIANGAQFGVAGLLHRFQMAKL